MSADEWVDRALQAAAEDAAALWMPRVWRALTVGIVIGAIGLWIAQVVLS